MDGSRRFIKYISDSVANLSTMIMNASSSNSYYAPTAVEGESESRIPLSLIGVNDSTKTLDNSLEWSREDNANETVVLKIADYEKMQSELSLNKTMIEEFKRKEKECSKMLRNYDRTLTYVLEKNGQKRDPGDKSYMKDWLEDDDDGEEISRLRHSEQRLKSHVQALKKDLFISEDKAEAFRQIAKEKIDALLREIEVIRVSYEEERRKVGMLSDKLVKLENAFEMRCSEGVELVEYCKYLMG